MISLVPVCFANLTADQSDLELPCKMPLRTEAFFLEKNDLISAFRAMIFLLITSDELVFLSLSNQFLLLILFLITGGGVLLIKHIMSL